MHRLATFQTYFYFEISVHAQKLAKTVQRISFTLNPGFRNGYLLPNYSVIPCQEVGVSMKCVYSSVPFDHMIMRLRYYADSRSHNHYQDTELCYHHKDFSHATLCSHNVSLPLAILIPDNH